MNELWMVIERGVDQKQWTHCVKNDMDKKEVSVAKTVDRHKWKEKTYSADLE